MYHIGAAISLGVTIMVSNSLLSLFFTVSVCMLYVCAHTQMYMHARSECWIQDLTSHLLLDCMSHSQKWLFLLRDPLLRITFYLELTLVIPFMSQCRNDSVTVPGTWITFGFHGSSLKRSFDQWIANVNYIYFSLPPVYRERYTSRQETGGLHACVILITGTFLINKSHKSS